MYNGAMNRWRMFTLWLLVGLALTLGAACGESPGGRQQVEVRFVTWKPNQPEVWDEIIRRFQAANPDIRLVREVGPHSSTAFHDLLTQKLKNASPEVDVFLMDVVWPPEFASAGWARSLDHYLDEATRRTLWPAALEANTWQDRLYGVPLYLDAGLLYYRKDLLAAQGYSPPRTWPELVAQARAIVAAQRAAGREMYGYSGQFKQYEGLVCDMLEFIASRGGGLVDPHTGRCLLSEPAAVEAVRFVRQQIIGHIAPRGVLTYQEPESLALFLQGKAVFMRNWPYAWALLQQRQRSQVAGRVGITVLPHFPGQASAATLGGWQVGISAFSRRPRPAWRFVSFLISRPIQKLLAIEAGRLPARRDVFEDPEVLEARPHFRLLRQVLARARPRPRTPLYPALSRILQVYFSRALSDPRVKVEELAAQTCRRVEELLSLAREY